jgi:hypothetical protein
VRHVQQVGDAPDHMLLVFVQLLIGVSDPPQLLEQLQLCCVEYTRLIART